MKHLRLFITLLLVGIGIAGIGQEELKPENIPTLNRIAEEYEFWLWVFSIVAAILTIWSFFGLKFFVKTKAEEWILNKIAKEADLKVEYLKAAIHEFAGIAKLKKKKITVISAVEGQQANVKKVFDECGFTNFEWKNIADLLSIVLENTAVILLNDQLEQPLNEAQIESVFDHFKTNVGYFYFGNKRLKSEEYREKYKITLDFCNSSTRLESGLLSILKIS